MYIIHNYGHFKNKYIYIFSFLANLPVSYLNNYNFLYIFIKLFNKNRIFI